MPRPDLIIFDCDGVLIDSEMLACRVSAECLTEVGIAIDTDVVMQRYIGVSLKSMLADIEERTAIALPADIAELLRQRTMAAFAADLKPIEGIEAALDAVNCNMCVASGNAALRHSLSVAGLLRYFDPHLFSADQVVHGKPAPDLFLFAAGEMGAEPAACLVIEDSVPGVRAGIAAGMRVLGFTGGGHCLPDHADRLRAAGATVIFNHMRQLGDLLRSLEGAQ